MAASYINPETVGKAASFSGKANAFQYRTKAVTTLALSRNVALLAALVALTSCAFLSNHHFTLPGRDWQSRSGQLMYRTARTTVVGDVLVRYSKSGNFELTFSKGPGVNLFTIEQDATNAQVKSSLRHLSWSGPVDRAPRQLRGWLSLREKLLAAPDAPVIRQTTGSETFVFRF